MPLQARKYIPESFKLVELFGLAAAGCREVPRCVVHKPPRLQRAGRVARRRPFLLQGVQAARLHPRTPHPPCRYTLGGFYLARYDESPAGRFDEVGRRLGGPPACRCGARRLPRRVPTDRVAPTLPCSWWHWRAWCGTRPPRAPGPAGCT
jgi:hypothetical protein